MKTVSFQYGDSFMPADLPDSAFVVRKGETYQDPPAVDPAAATRAALDHPLGMPPLSELAKPGMKVVIAFPDRVKGGAHPLAHRRISIPIVIETLTRAGVRREDISLVCAVGLHRKNTQPELRQYLGSEIMDSYWGRRITMHDAEDAAGIVDCGVTDDGDAVQVNRLLAEADLPILIGHAQGNPYGGYSGGYKMLVTGLTTWQSIRCHHTPATMFRPDFLPAGKGSHMRRQFDAIGRAIEAAISKQVFVVDAVLGADAQVLGVWAGQAGLVQEESWKLAERRTNVELDMTGKADVLIFGLPRSFHYGPGMGTNPILMMQAIGGQLTRAFGAFRDGGVVIAPSICDGWFNDEWFPSYREIYEHFQDCVDQSEATRFEEQVARNAGLCSEVPPCLRLSPVARHVDAVYGGRGLAAHQRYSGAGCAQAWFCPRHGMHRHQHHRGGSQAGGTLRGQEPAHSGAARRIRQCTRAPARPELRERTH